MALKWGFVCNKQNSAAGVCSGEMLSCGCFSSAVVGGEFLFSTPFLLTSPFQFSSPGDMWSILIGMKWSHIYPVSPRYSTLCSKGSLYLERKTSLILGYNSPFSKAPDAEFPKRPKELGASTRWVGNFGPFKDIWVEYSWFNLWWEVSKGSTACWEIKILEGIRPSHANSGQILCCE